MRRFTLACVVAALLPACARTPACDATVVFQTEPVLQICAEVADSPSERARGLMGRDALAPDAGMLFLWPQEEAASRSFHMFRTLIPLDLVVMRAGEVREVLPLEPCTAEVQDRCPSTPTAIADAVLEVPAGTAAGSSLGAGIEVRVARP